jgi:hypothetical protein
VELRDELLWENPSIKTESEISGKVVIGLMVNGPVPDILNLIVSNPEFELADVIAVRIDPEPVSLVFVTV